jgi:hypothetical protein
MHVIPVTYLMQVIPETYLMQVILVTYLNLKVFWSKKPKGPKQDSQNWLRSHIPEGGID